MPKQGDRVTLSASPTIQIADYKYLKPHAAITRDLGPDVEGDLKKMEAELRRHVARSILVELNLSTDLYDALNENGVEGIADFCMKEIGYEPQSKAGSAAAHGPGKGDGSSQEGPRKKGPQRKA
jgi:hypothetical protein